MSRYLAIFIEPTPYIAGLLRELLPLAGDRLDVLFIYENGTQQWNVPLDGLNARTLPSRPQEAFMELYRLLRSGRYAVLHLAGWSEPLVLAALLMAWLLRIPAVVESDTQFSPDPPPLWKRGIKKLAYSFLFRLPAVFMPGGKRQAAYLRHYGVKPDRMVIACMTVDVARIAGECERMGKAGRNSFRSELGFNEGNLLFVFVGRLVSWKGIDILLQSFEGLSRKFNHVGLLIIGDGPMRALVESATARNASIKYLGRLDSEGVIRVFHAGDVAVVPSLVEPWGLVVNEAMAAGLPVITTRVVGCTDDLNPDGSTGIIVNSGSADELLEAMGILVRDDAMRLQMGKNAKELISGWTLEREAQLICSVWRRLLPYGDLI